MSKLTNFLYRLARASNDLEKVFQPKKIPRRIKNKIAGRIGSPLIYKGGKK